MGFVSGDLPHGGNHLHKHALFSVGGGVGEDLAHEDPALVRRVTSPRPVRQVIDEHGAVPVAALVHDVHVISVRIEEPDFDRPLVLNAREGEAHAPRRRMTLARITLTTTMIPRDSLTRNEYQEANVSLEMRRTLRLKRSNTVMPTPSSFGPLCVVWSSS